MDLNMVLNELSIQSPAPNVQTARCWMLDLIHTLGVAAKAGVRQLRISIDLNSTVLTNNYPLARWRNDNDVDLEARRYFKSLFTKYPLIDDLPEVKESLRLYEFSHQNHPADSLGIAFLLDGLAISFASSPIWDNHEVELNTTHYIEEDDNLSSDTVKVHHASQPLHINHLTPWIKDRLRTGVQDGADLWNRRGDLFPSLIFCEHIGKYLEEIHSPDPILRQIVNKLFEIENYCKSWQGGPFNPDLLSFKITGDRGVTIQKYPEARTFLCPDGEYRIFTWHCRLTPDARRIYFDPSAGPGRIRIGNIGPKPPSVKYPT